jgi:putative addiction module component (TIGR02574 family)
MTTEKSPTLTAEIRLQLVERLLENLSPSHKEIDELWAVEAERRVAEIEKGEVKTVPGDEVFRKLHDRLKK